MTDRFLVLGEVACSDAPEDKLERVEDKHVERVEVFRLGRRREGEQQRQEVRRLQLNDEGRLEYRRKRAGISTRFPSTGQTTRLTWSVDFSNASPLVKVDPTASLIESRLRMMCKMSEMMRSSFSCRSLDRQTARNDGSELDRSDARKLELS